jgi:hypothetical protein
MVPVAVAVAVALPVEQVEQVRTMAGTLEDKVVSPVVTWSLQIPMELLHQT